MTKNDLHIKLDSVALEQFFLALRTQSAEQQDLDWSSVEFDTEKPADTLTGLPPIKAVKHGTSRRKAMQATEAVTQRQTTAETQVETTDQGTHESTEQQHEAIKQPQGLLRRMEQFAGNVLITAGLALLVIAAIRLYNKRKTK